MLVISSKNIVCDCSYLVTTFATVPRGTEGGISIEGTLAGLLASTFLASVGFLMGEVKVMLPMFFSKLFA